MKLLRQCDIFCFSFYFAKIIIIDLLRTKLDICFFLISIIQNNTKWNNGKEETLKWNKKIHYIYLNTTIYTLRTILHEYNLEIWNSTLNLYTVDDYKWMKRNLIKYCLLSYEVCVCLIQQNKLSSTTNAIQNKPNHQAKPNNIFFTLLQSRILLCICLSRYIYTTKCLCKKVIFSYFMSYDRFVTKVIPVQRVSQVEQELLTLPEHTSSSPVLSGVLCCSIFNFLCNVL